MYLPQQNQISKSKDYINAFGGYNHQVRISESEFYDMRNMTSDQYPAIAVREPRNYTLKIASSEYEEVETMIEASLVEDSLSKKTAVYTITADVEGGGTYEIGYAVNEQLVAEYEQKIGFNLRVTGIAGSSSKDEAIVEGRPTPNMAKAVTVPKTCVKLVIVITATWNGDRESWIEENLSEFVRDIRLIKKNDSIRAMVLKNGELAYLINDKVYWNGQEFDFSEYADTRDQQMIAYGAYILIFPMGVYINTNDVSDRGSLGAFAGSKGKTVYSLCNLEGAEYEYVLSETAPEDPKDGQYWMRQDNEDALYQWSDSMAMWTAVGTTYVRIQVKDDKAFFDSFEVEDAIYIDGSDVESLNTVNTIVAKGTSGNDAYIVVTGILSKVTEQSDQVSFTRKIPVLDHVCVSNNRVWGCHYGMTDGEMLNEIYACKLGDPKNWYSYQGTSLDSYALSLGDEGEFTGACCYQGYPLFFKEDNIYKIYGTYPAAYQLTTYDCRGAQKGSSKAITIVDEYLVYKSINDICVFDGNYPSAISDKLGRRSFSECAGGAYMSKYYMSALDEDTGEYAIYVYDFKKNLWMRDELMQILEFVGTKSGELYGRTKTGIVCFGNRDESIGLEGEEQQENLEWFVEMANYGFDSPERKFVSGIKIRAAVHFNARMKLEVYYDDSGKWNEHWIEKGGFNSDGKIRTFEVPILPVCCDTMRLRLSGVGKVEIYSILKKVEEAGR